MKALSMHRFVRIPVVVLFHWLYICAEAIVMRPQCNSECFQSLPIGVWRQNMWKPYHLNDCFVRQFFQKGNIISGVNYRKKKKRQKRRSISHKYTSLPEATSILLIGDSLDRNAVQFACEHFGIHPHKYLNSSIPVMKYQFCVIPEMNLTLANFMSFGVFDPPYWKFAYVDEKKKWDENVAKNSYSHIETDTKLFNAVNSDQDPDLVVFQSYLWDLSREWLLHDSPKVFTPSEEFFSDWISRVKLFITLLKERFPEAQIIWRTAPYPAPGSGRNKQIIDRMNHSILQWLKQSDQCVKIVEWNKILSDKNSPEVVPRTHPGVEASLGYINLILNVAEMTQFCGKRQCK